MESYSGFLHLRIFSLSNSFITVGLDYDKKIIRANIDILMQSCIIYAHRAFDNSIYESYDNYDINTIYTHNYKLNALLTETFHVIKLFQ